MSLLLCGALVGICLLRDAGMVDGMFFVNLGCECGLTVERSHLMIDVLAVIVWHLHSSIEVIQCAVRHF